MCTADQRLKLIIIMLLAALAGSQLSGCASVRFDARTGSRPIPPAVAGGSVTTTQLQVSGGNALGAVIVLGILMSDGLSYFRAGREDARVALNPAGPEGARAADTAPAPRVNVQDCTLPIDTTAGNLRCR
jgi:hypothetical protein